MCKHFTKYKKGDCDSLGDKREQEKGERVRVLPSAKHTKGLTGQDSQLNRKPEVTGLYKHQHVMTNEYVSGSGSTE